MRSSPWALRSGHWHPQAGTAAARSLTAITQDGTPPAAQRRPAPGGGSRPLYSLAAPPPCRALWGPPLFALVPGAGLKRPLAVRALERDPPFGRRMPLWLPPLPALGDTCREQRRIFCWWRILPPKCIQMCFLNGCSFFTSLLFSPSSAWIKRLVAHYQQLRFSCPSISPSLQMVPNDYLGNPSLEPSVLTLIHTPLLASRPELLHKDCVRHARSTATNMLLLFQQK